MATKRVVPQSKHGASGYQPPYNCRCLECRSGHAERQRNRRATGSGSRAAVANLARARRMGATERAVIAEVEQMSTAPAAVDVLAARNLARILDNEKLVNMWPRATAEFVKAMYTVHPKPEATKRRKGRLAAVRKITNERTTT